jgi:hypothetical protein
MWKAIKGHPLYEVSRDGQVRSLDKYVAGPYGSKTFSKGRILKPWLSTSGYKVVQLTNGKREMVHRLVAKTFIRNPDNLPCVNHIDGNKLNNHVDNLEWTTYSANSYHAKDIGLKKDRVAINQIDPITNETIKSFESIAAAARALGVNHSGLAKAVRGVYKTYVGYKWERVTTIPQGSRVQANSKQRASNIE